MNLPMDILEKKLDNILNSFQGQVFSEVLKEEMKDKIQAALDEFFYSINQNAPRPLLLFQFDGEVNSQNEIHLIVEFLHPFTKEEIALSEWQDEFENGVLH